MKKLGYVFAALLLFPAIVVAQTTFHQAANGVIGELYSNIDDSVILIPVKDDREALWPEDFPYYATISGIEIVSVVGKGDDDEEDGQFELTVERGQDDTGALPHFINATIRMDLSAGYISEIQSAVNEMEGGIGTNPFSIGEDDITSGRMQVYGADTSSSGLSSFRMFYPGDDDASDTNNWLNMCACGASLGGEFVDELGINYLGITGNETYLNNLTWVWANNGTYTIGYNNSTMTQAAITMGHNSSSALLGIGTTNPQYIGHVVNETNAAGNPNKGLCIGQYASYGLGSILYFEKARGTLASPLIVADTGTIGSCFARPYDGVKYLNTAGFGFVINGIPDEDDVAVDVVFSTDPTGLSSIVGGQKLRLKGGVPGASVWYYDDSNFLDFTISNGGDLTLAPSGGDMDITGTATVSSIFTANDANNIIRIGGGCNMGAPPVIGDVQANDVYTDDLEVEQVFSTSAQIIITIDDTTPDVSGGNVFVIPTTWTIATDVTSFDNGVLNQEITVVFGVGSDTDFEITESPNIQLEAPGTNWNPGVAGDLIKFQNFGSSLWYETTRSNK